MSTIVSKPDNEPDKGSKALGKAATTQLTVGSVYFGIVADYNLNTKKATVTVNGTRVSSCLSISMTVASMIGFTDSAPVPIGTPVLLVYQGTSNYFIPTGTALTPRSYKEFGGSISGNIKDTTKGVKQFKTKNSSKSVAPHLPDTSDILPGEVDLKNGMGVALRLLCNLVQLSAGDLAKVEACVLNDMVRIVDNYFVHHSVGGDDFIWSNGGCNSESHFTSYQFEAEGKMNPNDKLVDVGNNIVDATSVEDSVNDTGRWRKSSYMGFLGDFIHMFITDPASAISSIGESATRAGKFRSWVGNDGMLMVQSSSGVFVELTQKIVVPTMLHSHQDPAFDQEAAMKSLDSKFLAMWGKGPKWDDMSAVCWQMRSYAKYITLYHSLRRFKQLEEKGYCKIATEKEAAAPKPSSDERDKLAANPGSDNPYIGHAIFSIDPSGSVSLISNGNTSIIMNNGSIQMSAPGNIDITAGGTFSVHAKQGVVTTVKNFSILSLTGGIYMKARSAISALCELGRIWLKSDALPTPEENNEKAIAADPLPEDRTIMPAFKQCGIVLDATSSKVLVQGSKGATVAATSANSDVVLMANKVGSSVKVSGYSGVNLSSGDSITANAPAVGIVSTSTAIKSSVVKVGESVFITKGNMTVASPLTCTNISATGSIICSAEHVSKYQTKPTLNTKSASCDSVVTKAQENDVASVPNLPAVELTYKWGFGKGWTDLTSTLDIISPKILHAPYFHDSIAAQAAIKDKMWSIPWNRFKLLSSERTDNESFTYPGKGAQYVTYGKVDVKYLGGKWDKQFTRDDIASVADLAKSNFQLYINKPE